MTDNQPENERWNGDRVASVLAAQRQRVLRALLDAEARPADPILRDGEILDSEDYLTVCYELHHEVLPGLANDRLVEFDRSDDEVRRGARFEDAREFLEEISDEHES